MFFTTLSIKSMKNVKHIGCISCCSVFPIQIKSITCLKSESQSRPLSSVCFSSAGCVRGSCFMSCLVLKSVGLQRASHLCEEKLWTHQTDRELCEDRHEADCTHSTRHGPLGEAERTKEVKLLRLAEAILLITIWSLFFFRPSPSLTCHHAFPSLFRLPLSTDFKCGKPLPPTEKKLPLPLSRCLSREDLHSDLADNRLQIPTSLWCM